MTRAATMAAVKSSFERMAVQLNAEIDEINESAAREQDRLRFDPIYFRIMDADDRLLATLPTPADINGPRRARLRDELRVRGAQLAAAPQLLALAARVARIDPRTGRLGVSALRALIAEAEAALKSAEGITS